MTAIYIVIGDWLMYCLVFIVFFSGQYHFVVDEVTVKVAVITSSVAKNIFGVAEITFKVAVITSSVDNISLFVAKITFVVAEITLKWLWWLL